MQCRQLSKDIQLIKTREMQNDVICKSPTLPLWEFTAQTQRYAEKLTYWDSSDTLKVILISALPPPTQTSFCMNILIYIMYFI